ncbi:MAG: circadian clock KaiB family protein [Terriglobales bacterium]
MRPGRKADAKIVSLGSKSDVIARLEGELAPQYDFRLYIAGTNLNSVRAIENVRRLCRILRPSRCDLDIIDLYQQPGLARRDEVVAAPALIKIHPLPRRTFVGDLSDTAKVVAGVGDCSGN